MLEISDRSVEEGLELAFLIIDCHDDFLKCIWDRGEKCEKCGLVEFRKKFEEQSPAFFALFKKLSDKESIMKNLEQANLYGNPQQKGAARECFHDLQTFAEGSIAALFPLFKSNNDLFPFLRSQEIEEIQKDYLSCDCEKAEKELRNMNPEWFSSLAAIFTSFYGRDKELWAKKIYLLIKIFLYGAEKERERVAEESGREGDVAGDVERFLGIKKTPPDKEI